MGFFVQALPLDHDLGDTIHSYECHARKDVYKNKENRPVTLLVANCLGVACLGRDEVALVLKKEVVLVFRLFYGFRDSY